MRAGPYLPIVREPAYRSYIAPLWGAASKHPLGHDDDPHELWAPQKIMFPVALIALRETLVWTVFPSGRETFVDPTRFHDEQSGEVQRYRLPRSRFLAKSILTT